MSNKLNSVKNITWFISVKRCAFRGEKDKENTGTVLLCRFITSL